MHPKPSKPTFLTYKYFSEPLYRDSEWGRTLSVEAKRVIDSKRFFISNYCLRATLSDIFNFKLHYLTNDILREFYSRIHHHRVNPFKVAISFGYLLQHKISQEVEYYYPSLNNQNLFDVPQLIQSIGDHEQFLVKLDEVDLELVVNRPNTQWRLVCVTNVAFFVTTVSGRPIGHPPLDYPKHFLDNKGLISLVGFKGKRYNDDLCVFRALAIHRGASHTALETPTKALFAEYCQATSTDPKEFVGVTLPDLEEFSRVFACGVRVYTQDARRNTNLAWRSIGGKDILNLHLYEDHFSYIKDLNKFSRYSG